MLVCMIKLYFVEFCCVIFFFCLTVLVYAGKLISSPAILQGELLLPLGIRRFRPSSSLAFPILINSSETTGPIWTKLGRDGPCVIPFQNYVRRPRPPTKVAAVAKNRKFGKKSLKKIFLSETVWPIETKLW